MRPLAWLVCGAVVTAPLVIAPPTARACICPLTTVDVWPSGGAIVPLNTHVWVTFALDKGWDDTTIAPTDLVFAIRPPEPTRAQKKKAKKKPKKKGKAAEAAADTGGAAPSVEVTVRTGSSGCLLYTSPSPRD